MYRIPQLSADDLERRRIWASKLVVPETLEDSELLAMGRTKIVRGEAVFLQVTDKMEEDVFKFANTPKDLISDDLDKALRAMTKEVIGDETLCGPNTPAPADEFDGEGAAIAGGTAYERQEGRNVPSSQGRRCYQNTITSEQGTGLVGPAANLKGTEDDDLRNRKRWNMVRSVF